MTTRKPFSIRTQNELNISNKANDEKQKIIGDLPNKKVSTKIIKVNTRSNSKVYINKTLHVENKQNQQKGEEVVKKIEDIENHSPVEEVKKETKTNIALPQLQIRKIYSIFELLQLEPTKSPSPIGFENWPEELKNPKPKDSSPFKPSKKSIQPNLLKRSPLGEAINTIINNSNNSVVCKNVESLKSPISPQKSLVSIPTLKIDSLVPSSPNKSNVEVDERRLEQRQKQIDLGKKTLSYYMYCKKVPIYERKKGNPFTPRKNQVCSKRSWDGQVRKWRRMLHEYDPQTKEEIEEAMLLFPEETKYLLQRKDEKQKGEEDEDSLEIDD